MDKLAAINWLHDCKDYLPFSAKSVVLIYLLSLKIHQNFLSVLALEYNLNILFVLLGFKEGTERKPLDQSFVHKWKFPKFTYGVALRVTKEYLIL